MFPLSDITFLNKFQLKIFTCVDTKGEVSSEIQLPHLLRTPFDLGGEGEHKNQFPRKRSLRVWDEGSGGNMPRPGVTDYPLGVIDRTHWESAKLSSSELDGVVKMVVVMHSKYLLGAALGKSSSRPF